ncbi:putative transferase CAF17 homolog, mitochondrial [Halyomorpha halys]|uniref:putative transferase CAF17 homolog, mitochondrial n=1 Tax=Halyomorpha halys TaxID=286706 RepID=UPI0006D5212A|nr:putative transferase CAF17 homolog, mitochondrial [Halyomorpha halys]
MLRYPVSCTFLGYIKRSILLSCRYNHSKTDFRLEELNHRKIVRLSGEESSNFLQGLVTNDVNNISSSMYTMFLNNRGRILFDSIIYPAKEKDTFLLECDSQAMHQLIKHLNMYKLRKKIAISLASELNVWCIYNPKLVDNSNEAKVSSTETFDMNAVDKNLMITPDPRTNLLGYRIIAKEGDEIPNLPKSDLYTLCRYKLGIGEGIDELLFEQSFPLEMNCDYLNGVSFNKGCYIGQELTARSFHTGVIRKRLMPLIFESEALGIPINTPIEDPNITRKSPIGKVRTVKGVNGIGLMRVSETIESKSLKIINFMARSYIPGWWPEETVEQTYVKIKK